MVQPVAGVKLPTRGKDDPGTEKFLDYFYKYCIETLFRPMNDIPEFKILTGKSPMNPISIVYACLVVSSCRSLTRLDS